MIVKSSNSFIKDSKKLPVPILNELANLYLLLLNANNVIDLPNIRKLTGFKNAYRIRIGDYRIGFYYENNIITLSRILHRKDIYKKFP